MSTNIDEKIQKALLISDVKEAANLILAEEIKSGADVAVIDDPTYPAAGQRGKAKGPSSKGSGYTDVEFADGRVLPLQTSLLLVL